MGTILGMDAIGFWIVATAALVNICGALLGNYLVLRRMSLIGDAISHSVLPGLAIAFLVSGSRHPLPMLIGAAAAGLLTVMFTELIHRHVRVNEDAAIGLVFTAMFALGAVLISRSASQVDLDADCVLYGILESAALDTVLIGKLQIPRITINLATMTAVIVAFVVIMWKELKLVSFDPGLAKSIGMRPGLVHYILMLLVASFTVIAFEAVGSILVVAMLVVPSATAYLLTDRLSTMALLSVAIGIVTAILGRQLASELATSVAGMMAVVAGGLLVVSVLLSPRHGYLARRVAHLRTATRVALEDNLALLYRLQEHGADDQSASERVREALGSGWLQCIVLHWARHKRYITSKENGNAIALTALGVERGSSLVYKHRMWETWLDKHTVLESDHLHDPAHRVEHFLSEDMTRSISEQSGNPEHDPHGRPIKRHHLSEKD